MDKKVKQAALLLFAASLLFLAFGTMWLPVTDPVESNYALTAKEMVTSGNWISPQIYGHFWYDKPIMVYWLTALSYTIFGFTDFASRFPAVLTGSLSAVTLFLYMARLTKDMKKSLWCSLFLVTSLEFWVISHAIITDQILFLFTIPTFLSAYIGLVENSKKHMCIAYGAAALACLTKGPVGLVLPGMLLFIWCLSMKSLTLLKRLFPWQGILVFLLIALPWYVAMYSIHGMDFINEFLGLHNIIRATSSEHPEDNHWYYYLVLLPVSLLPWAGFSIYRMIHNRKDGSPFYKFLMIWCWGTVLFYSIMQTKYVTYTYIAVIPCIILAADSIPDLYRGKKKEICLFLIPLALTIAALTAGTFYLKTVPTWLPFYVIAVITVIAAMYFTWKKNWHNLLVAGTLGLAGLYLSVIGLGLPTYLTTRSGVSLVPAFKNLKGEHLFFKSYSASYTYYSGEIAMRLVPTKEDEDSRNPLWNKKYAMPSAADQALKFQNHTIPVYLYVSRGDEKFFQEWPMHKAFGDPIPFPSGTVYKLVKTDELFS